MNDWASIPETMVAAIREADGSGYRFECIDCEGAVHPLGGAQRMEDGQDFEGYLDERLIEFTLEAQLESWGRAHGHEIYVIDEPEKWDIVASRRFDGDGWYTMRAWDESKGWIDAEEPDAHWVETPDLIAATLKWDAARGADDTVIEYLGDDRLPSELVNLDDDGWEGLRLMDEASGQDGAKTFRAALDAIANGCAPEFPDGMGYDEWRGAYEARLDEAFASQGSQDR